MLEVIGRRSGWLCDVLRKVLAWGNLAEVDWFIGIARNRGLRRWKAMAMVSLGSGANEMARGKMERGGA